MRHVPSLNSNRTDLSNNDLFAFRCVFFFIKHFLFFIFVLILTCFVPLFVVIDLLIFFSDLLFVCDGLVNSEMVEKVPCTCLLYGL